MINDISLEELKEREELFNEYRETKEKLENSREKLDDMREECDELSEKYHRMTRLIHIMLENNISPVEAKLRHTEEIEEYNSYNSGHKGYSTQSCAAPDRSVNGISDRKKITLRQKIGRIIAGDIIYDR